jgi:uncharacterized membrane protein SirB2
MYLGLKHLHSTLAYVALLALVVAVVMLWIASRGGKPFLKTEKRWALIGLISAHLQLVIGLVLYFVSHVGYSNLSGEVMGDKIGRLYALEHPLTMIIGIIFITLGYARAKRASEDKRKYKFLVLFYGLGLLLILLRIPWHVWPPLG